METKNYLAALLFCTVWMTAYGQQSGNSVYGQGYSKGKMPGKETLYLSDSTFIIEASVVQNVIADGYVATFGLLGQDVNRRQGQALSIQVFTI